MQIVAYLIDNNGCVGGNYGTYTVDGNIIDLTSIKYFDCATCTESTENNLNLFLKISRIILSEDESLSIAKFTATEGFSDFSWSCEDQRGYESEFTVDLSKLSRTAIYFVTTSPLIFP